MCTILYLLKEELEKEGERKNFPVIEYRDEVGRLI